MNVPALTARLAPHPDVVWRLVEGEVVLLNITTGQYYSLNEVGSRVWALLPASGISLEALRTALLQEFDADPADIDRDLQDLFARLLSADLVVTVETSA
jgi:hypothetical protein